MNSRFQSIAEELELLKTGFTEVTNQIWDLRLKRASAGNPQDFLPRRLEIIENERRAEFARLYSRLQNLLDKHFSRPLFLIDSTDDLSVVHSITQNMMYIRNAFDDTPPLGQTVNRLKSAMRSSTGQI